MELIEREGFLDLLSAKYKSVAAGEGHCIMVSGEAGIGKTSLVRTFNRQKSDDCKILQGTCDALFTPRPLAPLYDILWQLEGDDWEESRNLADRAGLFNRFFRELSGRKGVTMVVFEDIHWADEATLDLIKFLARRISQLRCLFILTCRDDEVHSHHPIRNLLGQLPPDTYTRLRLTPLSRSSVEQLAKEKGYSGEDVYAVSGGNPFYVNEILASYSPGIPDNIRDSVLSVFNRQEEATRQVWEILSVQPTGFETRYLEKMQPQYASAVAKCIEAKLLLLHDGRLSFKHELYRRTIETSLSPFVRIDLNKRILDLFREDFEQQRQMERIIHHAKNALQYDLVFRYAPLVAVEAACVGAHVEASKLYYSAIENYQGMDKDILVQLYESYAYECYLINRIKEAIIYQGKALNIWKEKGDAERTGNAMWFLSRLWWFTGNRKQTDSYAAQAIETLADQPPSRAKAMAFSNMSQLKMLSDSAVECIHWGEKAIAIAKITGNEEALCHALNNIGTVQMQIGPFKEKGIQLLEQSLDLALRNSWHEHAARAYTNMGTSWLKVRQYASARETLETGIRYCEERELDSWQTYMLSCMATLLMETGHWKEAGLMAEGLSKREEQAPVVRINALVVLASIRMREGDMEVLPFLMEAKTKAFNILEVKRILPVMVALLEYEWLTGQRVIEDAAIETAVGLTREAGSVYTNNGFDFWLQKARGRQAPVEELYEGFRLESPKMALKAAHCWEQLGCSYEQALALFAAGEDDKKKALTIMQRLGALAVAEKLKQEMRAEGIKTIPRGVRKTTQSNPALLTDRELGVLELLKEGLQNKEIGSRLFISAKTVDHHISSILFKLDTNSRAKAVQEATRLGILK